MAALVATLQPGRANPPSRPGAGDASSVELAAGAGVGRRGARGAAARPGDDGPRRGAAHRSAAAPGWAPTATRPRSPVLAARSAPRLGASIGATRVVTDAGWVGARAADRHHRRGRRPATCTSRSASRARCQHTGGLGSARPHRQREHRPALPDDGARRPRPSSADARRCSSSCARSVWGRWHRCLTSTSSSWGPAGRVRGRARRSPEPVSRWCCSSAGRSPARRTCTAASSTAASSTARPALVGGGPGPALGDPAGHDGDDRRPRRSPSTSAPRRGARPPYNGVTAYRPDFDRWLAGKAEAGGRHARHAPPWRPGCCATRPAASSGVRTDRPDGDLTRRHRDRLRRGELVPRQGGRPLRPRPTPEHFTLGVKEVLALPREVIDERFGAARATRASTSRSSAAPATSPAAASSTPTATRSSVGVVLSLPASAAPGAAARGAHRRPQGPSGDRAVPRGGELKEYSRAPHPRGRLRRICPSCTPTACSSPATPRGCASPPASGWRA